MNTEKQCFNQIKAISKNSGWKFKQNFIYKKVGDFLYSADFSPNVEDQSIEAYLSFKPIELDDIFWSIISEEDNSKKPLSFRVDGAFVIPSYSIQDFEFTNVTPDKLEKKIEQLIQNLDKTVYRWTKKVKSINDYIAILKPDSKLHSIVLVTSYVQLGDIDKALNFIKQLDEKHRGFHCKYIFNGGKDYYDLVIEYCMTLQNAKK